MEANNYSAKRKDKEGKWKTFGNVKKNQYGNYSLGLKNTPELKALVNSSAEWINFSLFIEKEKPEYAPAVNQQGQTYEQAKSNGYQTQDEMNDEIPF